MTKETQQKSKKATDTNYRQKVDQHKYMNVNVVACLGKVLDSNTQYYRSDFRYDIEMFKVAAVDMTADNRFLWLSRLCGTECFREREVYLKGIHPYYAWTYYANSEEPIRAYAVEVISLDKGRVKGNLYELDYQEHVRQVVKNALPIQTVTAQFKYGGIRDLSFEEYDKHFASIQNEFGRIQNITYHPESESSLQNQLKEAHVIRQGYTPAEFKR